MSTVRKNIISFLSPLLICLAIYFLFAYLPTKIKQFSLLKEQKILAERLGIRIQDYPRPSTFPINYFYSVLKPGMTKENVHSVVTGYEQAYTCGNWREIYYYFSVDDDDAYRFMILYDNQGNFYRMEGEDDDSSTLSKDGCTLGLSN